MTAPTGPADRAAELAGALTATRERIARACAASGRAPDSVALIAVTKYFPASDAAMLARAGATDLGESREQEAGPKAADCARLLAGDGEGDAVAAPRWHMVGRLQRNKARAVARWAHAVHSVDSVRLAHALARAAASALDAGERTSPLEVYLQVSIDGDPARGGVPAAGLDELADQVAAAESVRLAGLMAVAPRQAGPDAAFARLAGIRESFTTRHPQAAGLSAGMSSDLESAIAHGSTCVRVGTAIMGARPIVSP
ncbi:YggS family pyridoxal phosphate-dependent enzyme [Tomitella fengzijianii]|uniref:YggS family pyridoxal phosphate-dependent enzyme n=1 Tax=Tomitella fengzijianii TaxID=2597660 RepID=UPI001E59DF40|nr:YggS family pyridoxal phosphate-dependent enzyme [Tomitella fengzijianii]